MLYEEQEMLEEYIIMLVQNAGAQGVSLARWENQNQKPVWRFQSQRLWVMSQFKQYIQSFPSIQIRDDGEQNWAVHVDNR